MKIFLDSIGCRLNQSEIEQYAGQFRAAGHEIVSSAAEADYVIVNTCAVTSKAASDSRGKIRHASRLTHGEVVVTGCWSTLDSKAASALPGVTRVIPNLEKDDLVAQVLDEPQLNDSIEPIARQPLPGAHLRTRAFIKVQDGCDNHCTFCVTRLARGSGRSRAISEVLRDVNMALEGGTQEIVLTGVHLGSWGQDFEQSNSLYNLIETLLKQVDVPRLRLSSLEPWDLDENFFSLWSDPRLCRHLHLPLQSGSASTLRRMARKTTPDSFARLVQAARAAAPHMAITTDVITGFPGETEAEFQESLDYVRSISFAAGHVFTYSTRPGTAAARMPDQVPPSLGKQRNAEMRAVFSVSKERYQEKFVGQTVEVLWESTDSFGPDGWRLHGLTDNYLHISTLSPDRLWNTFSRVRLVQSTPDG